MSLYGLLSAKKNPNIQESTHVDCVDLRDCRIFRGGEDVETLLSDELLLPKKSPNIQESKHVDCVDLRDCRIF